MKKHVGHVVVLADDEHEIPAHPPGMWQGPRQWNEPPSRSAVIATVVCAAPYVVMLLVVVASASTVTFGPDFARNVAIGLAVAALPELMATISATRTARRTGIVADRSLAATCVVGLIAYIPSAAVTSAIALALAGD